MSSHYLIIGGGAAGTTAAETIRAHDKKTDITIVSDEPHRYYSRIMLSKPNFFLGKIPFDSIWLKDDAWYKKNKITFVSGKKAMSLDTHGKIVVLNDGIELNYDKLLLAVGGEARTLDIPCSDKKNFFYLRTLDDARSIIAQMKRSKKAVIIGGGFIGFEMCDMLHLAGVEVTVVVREPYFWQTVLDEESGHIIEKALEKNGVRIIRNAQAKEILGDAAVSGVKLSDGMTIEGDIIIAGVGIVYPVGWVKDAGVATASGIVANEYLETSARDVWAAGDAAEFTDVTLGERVQLGNWANAQQQGKTAALNMLSSVGIGLRVPFRLVSFYTAYGFDTAVAFAGDVRSQDRTVITRRFPELNACVRLLAKDGRLVGATLVNHTRELPAVAKLIGNGAIITGKEQELSDPAFNLSSLV